MSLIHWWPLTTDLYNKITNKSFSSSYWTQSSDGKLGNCYKIEGCEQGKELLINSMTVPDTFSLSCWIKNQNLTYPCAPLPIKFSNGSPYLTGGKGWEFSHTNKLSLTLNDGETLQTYDFGTVDTDINTWYHLAFCVDYNAKTIKLYVNGEPRKANNSTPLSVKSYGGTYPFTLGYIYGWKFHGCLNDLRIYDHCLSLKEVKLLSQGLVAHYKLDTPRILNLAAGKTYSIYNNNSVPATLTETGRTFLGYPIYRLTMTPTAASLNSFQNHLWAQGIYQSSFTFNAGTKYCYWIYYKPVTNTNIRVGGTASNISGWTEIQPHYINDGWYRVGQYRDGSVASQKIDSIFTSFYSSSAQVGVPISIDFCGGHLIENTSQIIENYGISNTAMVYDCSGYGNHGTVSGSLTSSINTPRYQYCTLFNDNGYISTPSRSYQGMKDSYTISYWSKITEMTGLMVWGFANGNRLNLYPAGGWFNWNSGDGSSNPFKNSGGNVLFESYNNAWHHYTITGNGSETKLYIDGDYAGTALTYKNITGTQIILSGWNSGSEYKWNSGQLSDFRIYATALSADAIKSLYQSSISFLNNGTLQCSEIIKTGENLFNEQIFQEAANSTSGNGTIEKRGEYYAYGLNPASYYVHATKTSLKILEDKFKENTQYYFDLWMDVDDVIEYGTANIHRPAGFTIRYKDGSVSGDNVLRARGDPNDINAKKGYQHIKAYSEPNKTIEGLTVYDWVGQKWYLRLDSILCEVNTGNNIQFAKTGIINTSQLNELSFDQKIHFNKGNQIYCREIYEL